LEVSLTKLAIYEHETDESLDNFIK